MKEVKGIQERLDVLRSRIQEEDFLKGEGLSNEENIFIFCYKPEEEMLIRHFIKKLIDDTDLICDIKSFNLYDVFLSICDDKHITEKIPAMEERKGKDYILKQLHSIASSNMFIKKMYYEPQERGKDILFLYGVGEVFPFMRVHALLEALKPAFPEIPILVMYPGTFANEELKLFNRLEPKSYYRAFNLI